MIPLGLAEVQANRDALAKTLYARLFDHMVERMNRVLFRNGTDLATADEATRRNARSIGILDIFGE
jgi:myosin heavy subunit